MELLVSVRRAAEVRAALAGGAHIIDAKEPARGALGPVEPGVLVEIAGALPAGVPLSAALGEARDEEDATRLLAALQLSGGVPPRYLKLGFAGAASALAVRTAIGAAVARVQELEGPPRLIAVGYADHGCTTSPSPAVVAEAAAVAGAAGVLLDTRTKDGRDLFEWMSGAALDAWVGAAKQAGLLVAVAGSLGAGAMPRVAQAEPHVVGVRGAACQGGRSGVISAAKVAEVREALEAALRLPAEPLARRPIS